MRKSLAWAGFAAVLIACGGLQASDITSGDVGPSADASSVGDDDTTGRDSGVVPGDDDDDVGDDAVGDDAPPPVRDAGRPPIDAGDAGIAGACTVGMTDCGVGMYCKTASCAVKVGTCTTAPTGTAYAPVCGCDELTYWNDGVAARRGMNVAKAGDCGVLVNDCDQCNGPGKGAAAKCKRERTSLIATCSVVAAAEKLSCWVVPTVCPKGGALVNRCKNGNGVEGCEDLCTAIQNDHVIDTSVECKP